MWSLIRKPRWIFLLVLALGLGSLFVRLGFWQWHKYEARKVQNIATLAGQNTAPVPIQSLFPSGPADNGSASFRRVTITGTYDIAHDLTVYGRVRNDQPGNEVITPLVLPNGRVVMINRGWIPFQNGRPDLTLSAPPAGTVHLTGVLEPPETTGTPLPPAGLNQIAFIDLSQLSAWLGRPVLPYWVHLQAQSPPQAAFPKTVPLPPLDGGPYFSYALQWWFFASLAFFGYPYLLRREVREVRGATLLAEGAAPDAGMQAEAAEFLEGPDEEG